MKKVLTFVTCASIFLAGCSNAIEENNLMQKVQDEQISANSNKLTEIEAIEISNEVLNKISTRTNPAAIPTFEYVTKHNTTRNAVSIDTLAYVINYPNDSGFVILATDKYVNPLLAFSDKGHFSFDNEIAKENFIDEIGPYLEINTSNTPFNLDDISFDNSKTVEPFIGISLNQRNPWDKYVIEEHPGCPVGCLAVAVAYVMTYSKEKLYYHDTTFQFKRIISAIENKAIVPVPTTDTETQGINLLPPPAVLSYDWGVDQMAKLLYWIGADLGLNYTTSGSGGVPMINSYNFCQSLNYSIPSGYANYNINDVTRYLRTDHIICLYGVDINGKGAHAWVSDGCMATVSASHPEQPIVNYIHCDWGWGGSCNGYFKGDIFDVGYQFDVRKYFAVKRDWK